jgi:L-ascorbate metabolism protein UlaG (beta-lactamase superfamily)
MRLKFGRPDLADHASLFDLSPAATDDLGVTFLGVSSLLVDDGTSALMTDGFFSRPSLPAAVLGRISPDEVTIGACLERALASGPRVEALVCVHSHFDHALDAAVVARRTGAVLAGGLSTANIGRGGGLREDQLLVVCSGAEWTRGPWTVRMIESDHCPPDRFPGSIDRPVIPPVKTAAYRCGEAWSILVRHEHGRSLLIQGSAGYVEGSLAGEQADVAYLGVGQLGVQPDEYLETYWSETVLTVGARRAVLIHWDDFFRPLPLRAGDPPLRALPYAGDDLDVTVSVLRRLAERDGVALSMPTLWERENPWA